MVMGETPASMISRLAKDPKATLHVDRIVVPLSPAAQEAFKLLDRLRHDPLLLEKLMLLMPDAGDVRLIPWKEFDALTMWLDGKK
jgi:hypothetical protein